MLDQFQIAAEAVGSTVKRFVSLDEAVAHVKELAGAEPITASFLPPEVLQAFGPIPFTPPAPEADRGFCISYAHSGIAATGSVVLNLSNHRERAATALTFIHAVFIKASTIVPDIYGIHDHLQSALASANGAYLSITTGPSRTADIERVLTIGVHGPKELHILVLEGE